MNHLVAINSPFWAIATVPRMLVPAVAVATTASLADGVRAIGCGISGCSLSRSGGAGGGQASFEKTAGNRAYHYEP